MQGGRASLGLGGTRRHLATSCGGRPHGPGRWVQGNARGAERLYADWGLRVHGAGSWQRPLLLGKVRERQRVKGMPEGARPPWALLCDGCAQDPAQDPGQSQAALGCDFVLFR